jgi:hypothetical protein
VAKLLYSTLGASQLIPKPKGELYDFAQLRSPEAARGKIIVLAKTPKNLVDQKETAISILTAKAGITAIKVERPRLPIAPLMKAPTTQTTASTNPKSLKGEGIKMPKILPGVVEGRCNQYAQTAQEAMEVGNRVAVCFTRYNQAKATVFEASQRFECARGRKQVLVQHLHFLQL